jgi:hypothetical protein
MVSLGEVRPRLRVARTPLPGGWAHPGRHGKTALRPVEATGPLHPAATGVPAGCAPRDQLTAPWTALVSSSRLVTSVFVVSRSPEMLAAFCSAVRTTLVGSMMPALNMSTH